MSQQNLTEHDGIVVLRIACGINKRHRSLSGELAQASDQVAMFLQFVRITALEFGPPGGFVIEPLTQSVAGRDLLHPLIERRRLFEEPSGLVQGVALVGVRANRHERAHVRPQRPQAS